jgi:hypothetical protein
MLPLSLKSTVKCHWCIFFKISKTFLFLRFWLDFFTQCTYKHLKTDYEQKYLDFGPKVPLRSPPPVYSTVHSVPHMYCIYCTTKNYNTVLVNISKSVFLSVFLSVCLSVCLPACLSVCLSVCINRFGLGPLHYILSCSDFGFEFAEIFVFEKRLPVSMSRGVDKIAWSIHFFQTFE